MININKYLARLSIAASLVFYTPSAEGQPVEYFREDTSVDRELDKINREIFKMSLEKRLQYIAKNIVLPYEGYHSAVETSESCNNYFLHLALDKDLTNRV
ncbi:hypothetical protein HYU21_02090, partial [Candidatus Woesearchaeota archaeon]|nr:hypothetical protein [Candidatus Woesearchaeota archaeon]